MTRIRFKGTASFKMEDISARSLGRPLRTVKFDSIYNTPFLADLLTP